MPAPKKLTTCDKSLRFLKRVGIGLAGLAAFIIYLLGLGNIVSFTWGQFADPVAPYEIAFAGTLVVGVLCLVIFSLWNIE